MVVQTQLAALDHNANVNRKQAVVINGENQGEKRYNVVCPKQRKNWVAKPIKEQKSYKYVKAMMEDVLKIQEGRTIEYHQASQKKCIAPIPKPPNKLSLTITYQD